MASSKITFCWLLNCLSFSRTVFVSGILAILGLRVVGTDGRNTQHISSLPGLYPFSNIVSVCQQSKVRVCAFLQQSFHCALSPFCFPIALGIVGNVVKTGAKSAYSCELYCGPLSEITISGMPCRADIPIVCLMTSPAVHLLRRAISLSLCIMNSSRQ